MSRPLRGLAAAAAVLIAATACSDAGNAGAEDSGSNAESAAENGGFGELYYLSLEGGQGKYTSKLLRWDGTADGEIETVLESDSARMFYTTTVSGDGAYAAFAESEVLEYIDTQTKEVKQVTDFPAGVDDCKTPDFAPGDGHELLVPDGTQTAVFHPVEMDVGNYYAVGHCMPQAAIAEGDEDPSIFFLDRGTDSITFVKPNREVVDTRLGGKATAILGPDGLHGLSEVSPTGSQVCVSKTNPKTSNPNRTGVCQVLLDVATGEALLDFDGADFTVRYNGTGLMLRKDGELSYYGRADDLTEPATTLTEPTDLAEAQLIAVTDA